MPATPKFTPRALGWSYDRYGNVSQSGTLTHAHTYTRGSNQIDGYTYDASGNITAYTDPVNGATAMSYDAENRVASVSGGGGAASYVYDAEGRRVAKLNTSGAATAVYLLGLGGEQVVELNGSGAVQHRNVYAGGKLLASYDATNNLHLHLDDWLGTRRAQTSASGTLEMTYQSFPFGDGYSATCVSGSCTDPTENHFTGKEHDNESGLDYFGARYMSSSMGRFMSPDWSAGPSTVPYANLASPQSLNLYAYVGNNPISGMDADGHGDNSHPAPCNTKACQESRDFYNTASAAWDSIVRVAGSVRQAAINTVIGVFSQQRDQDHQAEEAQQQNNTTGYKTQDAAAKAVLTGLNPKSIKENTEYAGLIYKDANGLYHYTNPNGGNGDSSPVGSAPSGTTVYGDYHTHGDYAVPGPNGTTVRSDAAHDRYNSDHFSSTDMQQNRDSARSNSAFRGYLGTPSGALLIYNPITRQEGPLQ